MWRLMFWLTKWLITGSVVGLLSLTIWASFHYSVSRETTIERAQSLRLTINPAKHAAAPYNAPVEQNFYVRMSDIPMSLREAVLFREDRHFYRHVGFNPVAVMKAFISYQFGEGRGRGGSTITQQLAKLLYVGNERTKERKIKELGVALSLEYLFTKDEILEMYLNVAPFGNQTRGIEAAARRYFGYSFKKEGVQSLRFNDLMAAQLAVTLSAPSNRNPSTKQNRTYAEALLKRMAADGYEIGAIPGPIETKLKYKEPLPNDFRFYRDRAVSEAAEIAPDLDVDLEATLFYRSVHQLYLELAIERFYSIGGRRRDYPHLTAMIVHNRTGGVTAQYGETAGIEMYPASLVKPLIALCALQQGMARRTTLVDQPHGNPPIKNAYRGYKGKLSLETSIVLSTNTTAVFLAERLGRDCLDLGLKALGQTSWPRGDTTRALALGAETVPYLDVMQTYLAIATCGKTRRVRYLDSLWAPNGTVFEPARSPEAEDLHPVLQNALDQLHAVMFRVAKVGTARGVFATVPIAAKTGTSDDNRQVSLVTFTSEFTVLVTARAETGAKIRNRLWGSSLASFARNLNANIHIGIDPSPLGCEVTGSPQEKKRLPRSKPAVEERHLYVDRTSGTGDDLSKIE